MQNDSNPICKNARAPSGGAYVHVAFLKRMTRHRATKQSVIKPVVVRQEEVRQAEKDRQRAEQELLAMIEGAEGEG